MNDKLTGEGQENAVADPTLEMSSVSTSTGETTKDTNNKPAAIHGRGSERFIAAGAWLVAVSLVLLAGYLFLHTRPGAAAASVVAPSASAVSGSEPAAAGTALPRQVLPETPAARFEDSGANMPDFVLAADGSSLYRQANIHTIIPDRPREDVITYTVTTGDSVFGIAKDFNLKPESVLWANYDQLKDSPDMLAPGMVLKIPPADGVYYTWKDGDSLDSVASAFKAKPSDIVNWPGNHLDLTDPKIASGESVLIPGGKREFVQWLIPVIPRGAAGVSKSLLGPGACEGNYSGAYGSGSFIWPSSQHVLSGNDYWSGHLGIDIAGSLGDGIYAADSGVVVFAGWAYGGYGNMVMIDHGNGYQTLYGHMSSVGTRCGASVSRGGYIGAIGSTGNSTGPHLHFEVRYNGGWTNPWYVLP